jgi:hypothetical protein
MLVLRLKAMRTESGATSKSVRQWSAPCTVATAGIDGTLKQIQPSLPYWNFLVPSSRLRHDESKDKPRRYHPCKAIQVVLLDCSNGSTATLVVPMWCQRLGLGSLPVSDTGASTMSYLEAWSKRIQGLASRIACQGFCKKPMHMWLISQVKALIYLFFTEDKNVDS